MRKILLLAVVFATSFTAFGQDYSNKGKEFWLCFPSHCPNATTTRPVLSIFITSDKASTGTVTMPNGAYSATFNLNAGNNYYQELIVNPGGAPGNVYITAAESNTVINKSIHVKTDAGQPAVVVYTEEWAGARTAATLVLPVAVLGKKYYAVSGPQASPSGGITISGINYVSKSHFQIIATQPNTNVQITPRFNGAKQLPFTITLPNAGDLYQYEPSSSSTDITGTYIESLAGGSSGCLPVAVFSGTSGINLGAGSCTSAGSSDPLFQQCYPISSWGKNFGFIPFANYVLGSPYRIIASEDNTNIYINGVLTTTLNAGDLYPNIYTVNIPTLTATSNITADKPISVAQFLQSNGCANTNGTQGDPDMVILNPIEQNISDITVFSSNEQSISQRFLNVLIKTAGTTSFRINGGLPTTSWLTSANLPGYSYLRGEPFPSVGSYRLVSDSGFNAITYGYGPNESYAYSAGTNVIDLSKDLEIETTYGIETSPSVCTNSPFKFKFYIPDSTQGTPPVAIRFDSLRWDLSNRSIIVPNNFPIMVYPPCPTPCTVTYDSITIKNGKRVTWYSLPTTYYFNAPGNDTLLVTGYSSTNEGCGTDKLYDFAIVISDPPTASFIKNSPGCYLEPVVVTETTPQIPKTTYRQWWEFYDPVANITTVYTNAPPNPSTPLRTVSHTFTTPGVKRIRHASITTPGCLSDTIVQTIDLPKVPDGSIAGNATICANTTPYPDITFTMIDGLPPYRISYTINSVAQTPIVSPTGTYTISAPTTTPGTFVYELTEVRNDASTVCIRNITGQQATVVVRPLPNAAIGGATTVCLNSSPPPTVTFTGSNATAPYTFNYTINSVAQTPIVSNAAGIATVSAPTNAPGNFIYEITQITDGSSTTCSKNITGTTTTIIVQDLPNAAIASSTTAVCQNAAQPTVTFTGSGGTAPYTFNYTINTVAQAPVVSNAAGVATLNVPTTSVGSFIYEITQVREASGQTCLRAITGQTTTVTVNPLPNAAIAGATTVCLNSAPDPVVTFTGSNGTAPYTFNYTINSVAQPPVISNALGIATVNAPTSAPGTFIYAVTQVTDASSTACSKPITATSTTIVVKDLPNGVIASSTTAACLNSAPPPTITFTGNTGTAPYTFTYTINTVTQPTIVSNAAGVATINVPTNVATTYTYELTAVSEGSAQTCARLVNGQTSVVVINPLPTASVSGATAVCRNGPQPIVTFTGTGATAPYTFQYTINAIAQPPLVSDLAGIATIPASTTVAGTFTYQLTSVKDASSTTCSQAQNGSTVITINQLPIALFNTVGPRCANSTTFFNNTSTPNAAGTTTWAWVFGDPSADPVTNPNTDNGQNPTHNYLIPNTAPGYTVTLIATNSNGCVSTPGASLVIAINDTPRAGFIVPDVCINDIATVFTDTSRINAGNSMTGWHWDYGDLPSGLNNTSTGQNGSHLYPAPNNYTVEHIVTSNFGCKDTVTHVVTINSADPVAAFTPNNSCSIDSASIVNQSTVGFGSVTRIDIYWDVVGTPGVSQTILNPTPNGIYRHKYPTLQVNKNYTVRIIAYSGVICFNNSTPKTLTVYATPKVQFNNIAPVCYLGGPYTLNQGSEIGGVSGIGTYSGPGITTSPTFDPLVSGIGTFPILYTWTSNMGGNCIDTLTRYITVRDTAHAIFSVALPSCEQVATMFTNLSTAPAGVTIASTVWDFGDVTGSQTFPAASPVSHVYATASNYVVKMHTVSDAATGSCLSTDTMMLVKIDANQHITLTSANNTQSLCVNVPIADIKYQLSDGATGIVMQPSGLPPGVIASVNATTLVVTLAGTPTLAGVYNYSIQTTGNTCSIATTGGTITVNPDHTIALNAGSIGDDMQSICVNTSIKPIVFDLGGGATGIQSISPALPPGMNPPVISGNTVTISGSPSTTTGGPVYTITTSGNTCVQASTTFRIDVHPYPVPSFSFDNTSYCIPNAIVKFTNLTPPTPDGNIYLWDFGEPISGGANNSTAITPPAHWYSTEGPFNVTLSATAIANPALTNGLPGCKHDTIIVLNTIHAQPKAAFVLSKPNVCQGGFVTITDSTDGKGAIVNEWHWDLGDGTTSLVNPIIDHPYPDTTTYIISMYSKNTFGCYSDTINKQPLVGAPYKPFTVYPYPHINAGKDQFVLEGGSVELDATAYGIEPSYTWTPAQYLTDSKILRPRVVSPATDMTYRLTVTGKGNCPVSDDVFVKLLKFPTIPNTFTPNGDNINDKWVISFLNTYPDNRVQIFTRTGKLIFESRGYNQAWDGTYKGKPMPFDTYYYIIEPGNGRDPITGYVTILK